MRAPIALISLAEWSGSSLAEASGAQRDRQLVLNLGDTRRRPRGPFRNVALVPGSDLAGEDHSSTFGLEGDPRGVELGTSVQRFLDLLLDLRRIEERRDPDLVDDVDDTAELCTM
jgi:hypothetical protein